MNETSRTLCYLAVAAAIGLTAFATQPRPPVSVAASSDERFFLDWKDLDQARSFEIVSYDENVDQINKFSVAKVRGRWVIPSHSNYPADAEDQLKNIAAAMIDLKKVGGEPVSTEAKSHDLYGVKEPTDGTKAERNVGKLVSISDAKGEPLARLIVGKKAETDSGSSAQPGGREFHFVRIPGQDPVFVAELSPNVLTTKFEDWIERDLLKLNAFDASKLTMKDYSVVPLVDQATQQMQLQYIPRMDTIVSLDAGKNEWKLDEMTLYKDDGKVPAQLADDEELNKTVLDGVKTALDDLKIVDVTRRDDILAEALKDETKLARDPRSQALLQQKGFFVARARSDKLLDILGTSGEISLSLKDGVEYVLRFGNVKSAEQGDGSKLNRYLMVTARLDNAMLPPPELEEVPAEPAGPSAEEGKDEKKPEEEAAKKDDAEEGKKEEADAKAEEEKPKADDEAKKERDRIVKDNKRKLDDYNEKKKKSEARVSELNARFGDWFYVISEDVYKKIHLSRADIVKDRETAKDEGFGVDAFRSLEKAGIKKSEEKK